MDTFIKLNITADTFVNNSIKERFTLLNIKCEKDFYFYNGKIIPNQPDKTLNKEKKLVSYKKLQFFNIDEYDECIALCNEINKPNKPVVKKKSVPKFELELPSTIIEDYKHFDIDIKTKKKDALQDKAFKFSEYSLDKLFKFSTINSRLVEDSLGYSNRFIFTEKLYHEIIENNKIYDIQLYEFILFNTIISNECNIEFLEENNLVIDDDVKGIIYNFDLVHKYYTETFRPYFYKRYKDLLHNINEDNMRKLKAFDFHYKKIYPNTYNHSTNPSEYNKYTTNKKNLKKSYKMYLEGVEIEKIPRRDKLDMIIYIIDNVDFM